MQRGEDKMGKKRRCYDAKEQKNKDTMRSDDVELVKLRGYTNANE